MLLLTARCSILRPPRERAPDFVVERRFERAEGFFKAGQLADALRLYDQLWSDYEPHAYSVPSRLRMAEIDLALKNPEEAEAALRDVLAAHPTGEIATRAQLLSGDVAFAEQHWAEAREHYQRYLEASPQAPEAAAVLVRIGTAYEQLDQNLLALRAYDRALDLATRPEDLARIQARINDVLVGQLSVTQLEEVASLYRDRAIGIEAARLATERAAQARARPAPAPHPSPPPAVDERTVPSTADAPLTAPPVQLGALAPMPPPPASTSIETYPPPPPPASPVAAAIPAYVPPPPPPPPAVAAEPEPEPPAYEPPPAPSRASEPADIATAEVPPLTPPATLTVTPDLATTIGVEADVLALQRARQPARDAIPVACLLPLTGKYAAYGRRALDGVIEAADAFRPLVNAGAVTPVRFLIGDTQGEPERAAALFDQLVLGQHAVAVLGPMVSRDTEVVSQRAASAGVPILTLARKANLSAAGQWSFRDSLTDADLIHTLVSVAVQDMGIRRFAVLYPNEPYGMEIRDLFVHDVRELGGEIRAAAAFSPTASDFSAPVKALLGHKKAASPDGTVAADLGFDALFIPGSEGNVKLIAPQLGFNDVVDVQLLGTNSWNSPQLAQDAGPALQGALFLDGFVPSSPVPEIHSFVDRFERDFEREPSVIEALSFEAARVLRDLLESGTVRSSAELARALSSLTDYKGVAGLAGFASDGEANRKLKALTISGNSIEQVRWPVDRPGTTIRDIPAPGGAR